MKTKTLIPILLLYIVTANAQTTDNKKNIFKTNLTAYIFSNYNLTYERSLTSWMSIAVSYGKIPERQIPLLNQYLGGDESDFNFEDSKFSSTQITVEPRFYLGSGYSHGFYFAPYYRQSKIEINTIVYNMYFENTNTSTPVTVTGDISGKSYGLMLGSQWFIGKKNNWVLDFWILGGHYGTSEGNLNALSTRVLNPDEQLELKESLDVNDILSVVKFTSTTTTNSQGAKMVLTGPWLGLRSGLSFGYRF